MVTSKAILNGDKNRLLDFDAAEHPLVLQLGGSESDITILSKCLPQKPHFFERLVDARHQNAF
jgi:tRNA-dihydrouridine synthase A